MKSRNHTGTCIVRTFLLLLCAGAPIPPACADPILSNLTFGQADWFDLAPNSANLLRQYSSWGRLDFNVFGDGTNTYYLNVVGQKGSSNPWLIQNMPLFSQRVSDGTVAVSADFSVADFGLAEGTPLGTFSYGASVTLAPLDQAPGMPLPMSAVEAVPLVYRALTDDALLVDRGPSFGAPIGIKAAGATRVARDPIKHKDVPRVKEDDSQCMPGSFARSLSWLNVEKNLGSNKSAQQMYRELVDLMGVQKKLTEEERIRKKAEYARGIDKKIVTKVRDVRGDLGKIEGVAENSTTDLRQWLLSELLTEDVELRYLIFGNGIDSDPTGAHIVTVTGIEIQGDKTYLTFRDDESQLGSSNDNTGDKSEKRAELGLKDGKYWFRNEQRLVSYAVSESVVPEPATLLLVAIAILGAIRCSSRSAVNQESVRL